MRCHRVLFWSICTGLVLFAACSSMITMLGGAPALRIASRHRDASETTSRPEFNTESYAHQEDNPFLAVRDHPLSTFSIDVDTASYANVRRFVHDGRLPPKDAVRLEELVNYFRIEVKPPQDGSPLAAATEVGSCPWNPAHRLVRIGITGRGIEATAIPARNRSRQEARPMAARESGSPTASRRRRASPAASTASSSRPMATSTWA